MHMIYANLIVLGLRKLEDVPKPWRAKTEEELERRGWKEPETEEEEVEEE